MSQANTGLAFVAGTTPAVGQVGITPNGTVGYTITVKSKSNNVFTITKAATGITRTCTTHGDGGCKSAADSNGNFW
jgi:hypothetical protein